MSTQNENTTKPNERKWVKWLLMAIVVISFIINYSALFDKKLDLNGDNLNYLMLAQNLAEGKGYVTDVGMQASPHLHFPPGYPAFLSVFVRVFHDNITALKTINGILFLCSILLLFFIVRKTSARYGLFTAFVACMLCTFHPSLLRWSTILMSEMLYIAITLAMIAICIELDFDLLKQKNKKQIILVIMLCLLTAAAYFVRTMALSIIIAIVIQFLCVVVKKFMKDRNNKADWICPLIVSALLLISAAAAHKSWDLRNDRVSPGYSSDYVNAFFQKGEGKGDMQTMKDWMERIKVNTRSFVAYYIPMSIIKPWTAQETMYQYIEVKWWSWILGICIIAICMTGILTAKKIRWLLLLYFLATFGVQFLYQPQYAGLRYFVPLIPLIISSFISGIIWLTSRVLKGRICCAIAIIIALTLCLLYNKEQKELKALASIPSYYALNDQEPIKQYILASKYMSSSPEDILVACRKPEFFYTYSNRHHAVNFPLHATPEEILTFLYNNKIKAVIIDSWYPNAYKTLLPTASKYPQYFQLMQKFGPEDRPTMVLLFLPVYNQTTQQ